MTEAGAEPAEGDDPEELADKLERLNDAARRSVSVNPLAKEEYEREKERLTELREQRADLEASLKELADAPRRARRDGRAPLRGDLRRGPRRTSTRSPRRSSRAARDGCG